jgi:hypothetical protein
MIVPSGAVRVLVATRPVDFRKGMDGLAALVRDSLRCVEATCDMVILTTLLWNGVHDRIAKGGPNE